MQVTETDFEDKLNWPDSWELLKCCTNMHGNLQLAGIFYSYIKSVL